MPMIDGVLNEFIAFLANKTNHFHNNKYKYNVVLTFGSTQGEKDDKIIAMCVDDLEYKHFTNYKELAPHASPRSDISLKTVSFFLVLYIKYILVFGGVAMCYVYTLCLSLTIAFIALWGY